MEDFRLICYILSHISMMGFLMVFSRRRFTVRKTTCILAVASLIMILLECMSYGARQDQELRRIVVIGQILVVQGIALFISEFQDSRALFTGLVSSNYVLPGVMISMHVYFLTDWFWFALVLEIVINGGLLWGMARTLRAPYQECQIESRGRWLTMCLMPALFYLSASGLDVVVQGSGKPFKALLTVIFFLLTMYACYLLVFRMMRQIYKEQQDVKAQEILRAGIRALKREEEDLRGVEQRITAHLEDSRQIIYSMQEMLEHRDYEGVNRMLGRMQEMTELHQSVRYCDNAAINGVMVYYVAEARAKEVAISVTLDIAEPLRVNEWELSVMLGNLLDNAIRAAARVVNPASRSIQVRARQVRGQVLFEIRNHYAGTINFDKDTGLPATDRGKGHGIGLRSVAYFAESNQITFDYGVERNEFFVRMLV